jgi:ribonuclease R
VRKKKKPDNEAIVLARLRKSRKRYTPVTELEASTGLESAEFEEALASLARRGELLRQKSRVGLTGKLGLVAGRVRRRSRDALIIPLDDSQDALRVSANALRPAMDGDLVLAEPLSRSTRRPVNAAIHSVLERGRKVITGEMSTRNRSVFIPTDHAIDYEVRLAHDSPRAQPGCLLKATISRYPGRHGNIEVRIDGEVESRGPLDREIAIACTEASLPVEFSDEVLAEAERFREPGDRDAEGRLDLRDSHFVTIDGADARDFDDAICLSRKGKGWLLCVAIADASWYVKDGGKIDAEAFDRGTSVYFPGYAVPMLPERISTDLASLRPDRDRLTVSVEMTINSSGEVTDATFARSIIRSKARLTYQSVQDCLDGQPEDIDSATAEMLGQMQRCSVAMRTARRKRGALELDLPESQVHVDRSGDPDKISNRPRLAAHLLIEDFMLAANETVADKLERDGPAFPYRVHERPDQAAMISLASRLPALGLRLDTAPENIKPADLQALLERAAKLPGSAQVSLMILRSMMRARYTAYKDQHFGLASPCYAHFTSPIRRYPDLLVHRALVARLGGRADSRPGKAAIESMSVDCSRLERRAEALERSVTRAAWAIYLGTRIGRRYDGTISSVAPHGYYVRLDDNGIEGLVPLSRLDYYVDHDDDRMELLSRDGKWTARPGDRARVRVVSTDVTRRRIDFEPCD